MHLPMLNRTVADIHPESSFISGASVHPQHPVTLTASQRMDHVMNPNNLLIPSQVDKNVPTKQNTSADEEEADNTVTEVYFSIYTTCN